MSGNRYRNKQDSGRDIYSGAPVGDKRKWWIIGGCVLAAVAIICLVGAGINLLHTGGTESQPESLPQSEAVSNTFYTGIVVEGVDLGSLTMEEAAAKLKDVEPTLGDDCNVTLHFDEKSWELTKDDLTFTYNTKEVLREAYDYVRSVEDESERAQLIAELETQPKTFSITAMPEVTGLKEKLTELTKELNQPAKDATVKSFDASSETFTFTEGENGRQVDVEALAASVESVLTNERTGSVTVPVKEEPFSVTAADLKANMKKIGTYTTKSTNTSNGNHNMKLAMQAMNGTVVAPGETFSYFKKVGSCGKEDGYLQANAIVNGRLVPSYGGGICQTSTTLYGAVLRANMELVERSSHSIKSTYCPIGQDAAVSYDALDFKFKNPTKYPVYIYTTMEGKTLTATLYGYQSPEYDKIEVTSQQTEVIPAVSTPKYTVDKSMAKGTMRLDAKGREGYRASAQRVYYKNGEIVKTEKLPNSYYRPAPAYYSIGPDTDPATATLVNDSGKPVNGQPSNTTPPAETPAPAAPVETPSTPETPSSNPSVETPAAPESPPVQTPETPVLEGGDTTTPVTPTPEPVPPEEQTQVNPAV